jgi:hypothetical protein
MGRNWILLLFSLGPKSHIFRAFIRVGGKRLEYNNSQIYIVFSVTPVKLLSRSKMMQN